MRFLPGWIATLVVVSATVVGCNKSASQAADAAAEPGGSAKLPLVLSVKPPSAGPMASNIPLPAASVESVINPSHRAAYTGPTGAVEGVIKIKGDEAPVIEQKYGAGCSGAESTYGRLFREGPGRTAPDVLMAASEYEGYVPAADPAIKVTVKDCAYDRKTYVLTFGQRIEVFNEDTGQSYLPFLAGTSSPAHMVLPPKGQGGPVKLYPLDIGRYLMVDEMNRAWMKADIFVLKYSTTTISGLDGKYRIDKLPVGKLKVSAMLSAADLTKTVETKVEEGKTTTVDFVLEYKKPPPAPSASAPRKGPVVK
jgi:hypothetical protein